MTNDTRFRQTRERHRGQHLPTPARTAPPPPPMIVEPPKPVLTLPPKTPDSDRLLVMVLAVLLWQNGASLELILALVYIAM